MRFTDEEIDDWVSRWNRLQRDLRERGLIFKAGSPFTQALKIINQLRADLVVKESLITDIRARLETDDR